MNLILVFEDKKDPSLAPCLDVAALKATCMNGYTSYIWPIAKTSNKISDMDLIFYVLFSII